MCATKARLRTSEGRSMGSEARFRVVRRGVALGTLLVLPSGTACRPRPEPAASCAVPPAVEARASDTNVSGTPLAPCSTAPRTGWSRTGSCTTGPDDVGSHVVCAEVSSEFLAFTREKGNDLVTPRPGFPGLRAGDRWCLCSARWSEAEAAGVAPPVVLDATHVRATDRIAPDVLRRHAIPDAPGHARP
ncbi:MAG: DUF2237 domain-containing protein [Polyangiaceae bacterium]